MNYEETVNFIKLFLLLMNGGTFLLRTLIYKLILESGKSLDDLLLQSRDLFDKELKKNRKQFDLLFPGSSQNADIEQWDISLLTFVLLNVFKGFFNSSEITAIQVIRDHRNKILAHKAKSALTLKDFMSAWIQISGALTELSTTVPPEDQKELKSIESSIFNDPFQKDIDEQLKEMGQTDTLVHAVVENVMPLVKAKLSDSEKNTQMQFENLFQRMRDIEEDLVKQGKQQREHGNQIAVLTKMRVKTGSIRVRRQAQKLVLETSNKIISKDPGEDSSDDEVLSAVRDLFTGVEEQGVKVVKADEGSIILTILCPTVKSLHDVTYFLRGLQIQPKLSQLEEVVGKCCSCAVTITIDVDIDSLESAIVKLEKEIYTGAVYLALECRGAAGVEKAFQCFENCESPNKLNKISEALSRKVGEKVELETEIDIEKLEDEITKKKNQSHNCSVYRAENSILYSGSRVVKMSLSKILNDVEKMNWSKGPAALEILTSSLYDYIEHTWKEYLTTWSEEEQDYIPQFIKHAQWDWFEYCGKTENAQNDVWKCRICSNSLCKNIISRLLQIHQNPRSKNLNWNVKMSPDVDQYENYQEFFWEFAKMYMFYGKESSKEIFTCPKDTDITMILKMMKNCKLFELDDNHLYEAVQMSRNLFMHASHYKLTTEKLEECVNTMKSLLDAIGEKDDVLPEHKLTFSLAVAELDKLVKEKIRMDLSKEELDIIINALKWQEKSIQSDMKFNGINGQSNDALTEFLEANNRQIKHYTIIIETYQPILKIEDPDKRRKALEDFEEKARKEEDERKQREERMKRYIEERKKEEEEKKINDEVNRRVNEKLEEMRNKDAPREHKKEGADPVGAATGAAAGATAGLVLGPVGAVVGGALGALFGAKK